MSALSAPVAQRRRDCYHYALVWRESLAEVHPELALIPTPVYRIARCRDLHIDHLPLPRFTMGTLLEQMVDGEPLRTVLLAAHASPVQDRFTMAHELGHEALGSVCHGERLDEIDADAFASGLLMPHKAVWNELGNRLLTSDPMPIEGWAEEERKFHTVSDLRGLFKVAYDTVIRTLVDMEAVEDYPAWELASLKAAPKAYRLALKRLAGD